MTFSVWDHQNCIVQRSEIWRNSPKTCELLKRKRAAIRISSRVRSFNRSKSLILPIFSVIRRRRTKNLDSAWDLAGVEGRRLVHPKMTMICHTAELWYGFTAVISGPKGINNFKEEIFNFSFQNLSLKSAHATPTTLSTPKSYASPSFQGNRTFPGTSASTSQSSTPNEFRCHLCAFSTTRLNVIVLHNRTHAADAVAKANAEPTPRASGKEFEIYFMNYVDCSFS